MTQREHREQALIIRWAAAWEDRVPELKLLFAVPNAARRSPRQGAYMKAEGMKAGVPDLWLPVSTYDSLTHEMLTAGLVIEMKAPAEGDKRRGTATKEQKWWLAELHAQGYRVEICDTAEEAEHVIAEYLGRPELVVGIPKPK